MVLVNVQVVYPKSDQQRHRLSEAVKNIFLFRPLDQVSVLLVSNHFSILLLKVSICSPQSELSFEIKGDSVAH